MARLTIDTDSAAEDIGEAISLAKTLIEHSDQSVSPKLALDYATKAYIVARFILSHLDSKEIVERQRYDEFRVEAKSLISKIWASHTLTRIQRVEVKPMKVLPESSEKLAFTLPPTEKRHYSQRKPKDNRAKLTEDQISELRRYLRGLKYLSPDEMRFLREAFGISSGTVRYHWDKREVDKE